MKIIGHRGARGLAPENTIASFLKAIEHGVDEIECDVRVTSDGVPALIHDAFLTDQSGAKLTVAEHSFAELQGHKADLTTLDEAIKSINRHVPLIIEVKPAVPVKPVVETVSHFLNNGWAADDFRLSSRDPRVLKGLHAQLPDIEMIVIEYWSGVRGTHRARQVGATRLSMLEIWLWPGFIRAMKRGGYELYSFPNKTHQKERFFARLGLGNCSNNPVRARKWAKAGLAGVITDFPDRFAS